MALSTSQTAITDFFIHVLKVMQFLWINARMRKGSRVVFAVVYFSRTTRNGGIQE